MLNSTNMREIFSSFCFDKYKWQRNLIRICTDDEEKNQGKNTKLQNKLHRLKKDELILTFDNRKGQNFGFPLLPYLSKYAPFFKAVMAWCKS